MNTAFKTSKQIIKTIELEISDRKNNNSKRQINVLEITGGKFLNSIISLLNSLILKIQTLFVWLKRNTYYPLKLMPFGATLWIKDVKKLFIIFYILFFIFSLTIEKDIKLAFSNEIVNYIILIILAISTFISIYAIPSTYCSYKIDGKYIHAIINLLEKEKIDTKNKLDIILSNIGILEDKAKLRVKSIKVTIAFLFTTSIFLNKNGFSAILNTTMSFDELNIFMIPFWMLLAVYIFTNWYSKLVFFIFDTAHIACNEYKYKLEELN